jgi:hypothetical protein
MARCVALLAISLSLCMWLLGAYERQVRAFRSSSPPQAPVTDSRPETQAPPLLPGSGGCLGAGRIQTEQLECVRVACLAFRAEPCQLLVDALASDVEARRRGALAAIQFLGADAAPLVPGLVALVASGGAHAEVFDALEALDHHAAPAVGALILELRGANDRRALRVLKSIGLAAADARFAILERQPGYWGWETMASFGPAAFDVVPRIIPLLDEDGAVDALLAIDPEGTSLEAVRASRAPSKVLARLFGAWGAREEIPRLHGWLDDENARGAAAEALAGLGALEAVPALQRMADENPTPECVGALARLSPEAAIRLIPRLVDRIRQEQDELAWPDPAEVDFTGRSMLLRLSSQDNALGCLAALGPLARDVLPDLGAVAERAPYLYVVGAKIDPRCLREQVLRSRWGVYLMDWLRMRDDESLAARLRLLQDPDLRQEAAYGLASFDELPAAAVPALLEALPFSFGALARVRQLPASCAPRLLEVEWRWPREALAAVARLEPAGLAYVLHTTGVPAP